MNSLNGDLYERFRSQQDTFSRHKKPADSPRILELPDKTGAFIGSADIYTSKDHGEDMKPIAVQLSEEAFLLAAGDGLGGSGSVRIDTPAGPMTEARIATQAMGEELLDVARRNPGFYLSSEGNKLATNVSERIITPLFSGLASQYPNRNSDLRGSAVKERFPTTLSMAVIERKKHGPGFRWEINLALAGDSPIFILTENKMISTHRPGHGDLSMDGDLLSANLHSLRPLSAIVDDGVPFAVLTATDFILKLNSQPMTGVGIFLPKVFQFSQSPDTFQANLADLYQETTDGRIRGTEMDDATLAFFTKGRFGKFPEII